jgi:hypothetical protein
MAPDSILWPMLAHIGLTFFLYAWLTLERTKAVQSGETEYACFVLGRDEPLHVARITRNLANQFELPAIFYALVVVLLVAGRITWVDIAAAWVFVAGRLIPHPRADPDGQRAVTRPCLPDQFPGRGGPRRSRRCAGVARCWTLN